MGSRSRFNPARLRKKRAAEKAKKEAEWHLKGYTILEQTETTTIVSAEAEPPDKFSVRYTQITGRSSLVEPSFDIEGITKNDNTPQNT